LDSPCETYCCNPDSDPNGPWCFVDNPNCRGHNWDYCTQALPHQSTTSVPPEPDTPLVIPDMPGLFVHEQEALHFDLVNSLREAGYTCPAGKRYLPNPVPLKFDCRLFKAAREHSQDMVDLNYFSHDSLDGRSFMDRTWAAGLSANAENIAAACEDAACSFRQLRDSDAHCNNLMNPGMKMFAVSRANGTDSMYNYYWTQLMSAEDADPDTSCLPPH